MNILDGKTAKCCAFTSVKCHAIFPSLRINRKGKATLWLTPGLWYAYGVSGRTEQNSVIILEDTTIVFRFLNFFYEWTIDESEAVMDTK
jgi:hypothetical protein